MDKIINNRAYISGVIAEDFCYSHDVYGEKFYTSVVEVERKSGAIDRVPIMVSERLMDISEEWAGERVYIYGEFRSYNKYDGERMHLMLHLFALEFFCVGTGQDDNSIELDGYICKNPIYRKTPMGKEITDIILAVNRDDGKSDYIPCIAWHRNARITGNLPVGAHIKIDGRVQSRQYVKKLSEEYAETRTAYEVSIWRLGVLSGEECKDQVADAE